jgi:hypothetical protein
MDAFLLIVDLYSPFSQLKRPFPESFWEKDSRIPGAEGPRRKKIAPPVALETQRT